MNDYQAGELLKKFNDGKASKEEISLLERWYVHEAELRQADPEELDYPQIRNEMWNKIQQSKNKPSKLLWPRIIAAASVLLVLSVGAYFLAGRQSRPNTIAGNQAQDLAPGSDKAVLTLANGKQITVTGAKTGLLTSQGNTAIHIGADHEVVYSNPNDQSSAIGYNTMTTPRGGQHRLVLDDGTRIWLDAASSITFPVTFTGKYRQVKITGQVYFEVAHNPAKPFRVLTNGQVVEVLGTHFNINAYPDEPAVKTTLFEGSVKVSASGNQAVLKPGQQAQTSLNNISVTEDADMDGAIAWHKGLFKFDNADIPTVMRQLARWYDVDITYEGEISDQRFSGEIYRNMNALKVSDILSYGKIHFRIEGKKIIVMP
jgi:transmembrane sensor